MRWRRIASVLITALIGALMASLSLVGPAAAATPVDDISSETDPAPAITRWPGPTITIRNTLKGLKRIAANRAIRDWNTAGLNITFKLVKGSSAQVIIREAKKMPCAGSGCGTVGFQGYGGKGYVTMAAGLNPKEPPFDAVWYSRLVAHELGHILGLNHSENPNALMYPYPRSLKVNDAGKCRFRAKQDVARAKSMYGGKGSLALKTSCSFAKAAAAVPSLNAKVKEGSVEISWGAAKRAMGYTVRRGPAGGSCPANPRAGVDIWATGRTAHDYDVAEGKKYCYRVFPYNKENFYNLKGAKSTVFTAVTPRPETPTGITLIRNDAYQDEGWIGFDIGGISQDDQLWFAASTDSQCPTATNDFQPVYRDPDYPDFTLEATGTTRCIAFRRAVENLSMQTLWSPSFEVRVAG